jgi:hypothetical protein
MKDHLASIAFPGPLLKDDSILKGGGKTAYTAK